MNCANISKYFFYFLFIDELRDASERDYKRFLFRDKFLIIREVTI